MIITTAIGKGGVGKSTLVRALAPVAAKRGIKTTVVDADRRQNLMRWAALLDRLGNMPDNFEVLSADDTDELQTIAISKHDEGRLVFVDTEGTTSDELSAALHVADIVLVPVHLAPDDVSAALQLARHHVPNSIKKRGEPLPVMYVFTNNTVIDHRARALDEIRTLIQESGTRVASSGLPYRMIYKDMQMGSTLYSADRIDNKAIAETEELFDEILSYVNEPEQAAAE